MNLGVYFAIKRYDGKLHVTENGKFLFDTEHSATIEKQRKVDFAYRQAMMADAIGSNQILSNQWHAEYQQNKAMTIIKVSITEAVESEIGFPFEPNTKTITAIEEGRRLSAQLTSDDLPSDPPKRKRKKSE